jgi:hypothetical protein
VDALKMALSDKGVDALHDLITDDEDPHGRQIVPQKARVRKGILQDGGRGRQARNSI